MEDIVQDVGGSSRAEGIPTRVDLVKDGPLKQHVNTVIYSNILNSIILKDIVPANQPLNAHVAHAKMPVPET